MVCKEWLILGVNMLKEPVGRQKSEERTKSSLFVKCEVIKIDTNG